MTVTVMKQYFPNKKDDKTMNVNYRPISILPLVSKIFERILCNQIYTHISEYLSPYAVFDQDILHNTVYF